MRLTSYYPCLVVLLSALLILSLLIITLPSISDAYTALARFKSTPPLPSQNNSHTSITTALSNLPKVSLSNEYVYVRKWGSNSTGDGQFYYLDGIAVDSSGSVYVADTLNNRIKRLTLMVTL